MAHYARCHSGVVNYEKQAPCSIRMVILMSGQAEEPVRARLESICLNSIEDYEYVYNAVSYTWSSEERVVPMILNHKPILVTTQLGELFKESRNGLLQDQISRWWVDQLCINQDDDEDKAQQIPHMKTIYEKATNTTVWLKPMLDGQFAFDLIGRLIELSRRSDAGPLLHRLPLPEVLGPPTEENLRSWRALKDFMSNRYWTRTWILPEATAQVDKCLVVCDNLQRGLKIHYAFWIRNVIKHLWTRDPPPEYSLDNMPSSLVGRVENFALLQHPAVAGRTALLDLLYITRRTECSRPEDKIFTMLPFAADVGDYVNNEFIKPSYTKGCRRVYMDLIKWYVLKYRNLGFLGSCAVTKDWTTQIPGFDLPSWVPNWTHGTFIQPLAKYHDAKASFEDLIPLYSACGSFSHAIDIVQTPDTCHDMTFLSLSGIYITTVCKVLEAAYDGGFWQPEVQMSWQDEFDDSAEYPLTAEPYRDAFERTIVADVTRDFSNNHLSRPGRVNWPYNSTGLDPVEQAQQDHRVTAASGDRRLFFARSRATPSRFQALHSTAVLDETVRLGSDCKAYAMGLGRSDLAVGDEIWALKGGQVLYALRPVADTITFCNTSDGTASNQPSHPELLWLNGKAHSRDTVLSGPSFSFIGECYVHGLMDGEALDIAALQPTERPEILSGMSSDFTDIFIGGTFDFPVV